MLPVFEKGPYKLLREIVVFMTEGSMEVLFVFV